MEILSAPVGRAGFETLMGWRSGAEIGSSSQISTSFVAARGPAPTLSVCGSTGGPGFLLAFVAFAAVVAVTVVRLALAVFFVEALPARFRPFAFADFVVAATYFSFQIAFEG
jgi:hypothetical protein